MNTQQPQPPAAAMHWRAKEILTPPGRLVWTQNVFHAGTPDGVADARPAFNIGLLVDKQFASTSKEYAALVHETHAGAVARFGAQACVLRPDGSLAFSIRHLGHFDGDTKAEHYHGHWLLAAKCEQLPVVLTAHGNHIVQDERKEHVYAGAFAQLLVRPYFWDKGGRGGHYWLLGVKLLGGGERQGAGQPSADEVAAAFAANPVTALPPDGVAAGQERTLPAPSAAAPQPVAAAPAALPPAAVQQEQAAAVQAMPPLQKVPVVITAGGGVRNATPQEAAAMQQRGMEQATEVEAAAMVAHSAAAAAPQDVLPAEVPNWNLEQGQQ